MNRTDSVMLCHLDRPCKYLVINGNEMWHVSCSKRWQYVGNPIVQ